MKLTVTDLHTLLDTIEELPRSVTYAEVTTDSNTFAVVFDADVDLHVIVAEVE